MTLCRTAFGAMIPLCSSLPFIGDWTTRLEEPYTLNGLDDFVYHWLLYLCQQAYSLVATGWLEAVINLTNWATGTVCYAILGGPTCISLHKMIVATAAMVCLLTLWYLLDRLLKPVLWVIRICHRSWLYFRGTPDDETIHSVHDCEWIGPDTDSGITNELYRDHLRGRSITNKKANHLVIEVDGHFARLSRATGRMKAACQHGQLWSVGEIVSTSGNDIRRLIDENDPPLICCCRHANCQQPAAALHVKAYAGVDANIALDLRGDIHSITHLCCLKMYALMCLAHIRFPRRKLLRCRQGLCPRRRPEGQRLGRRAGVQAGNRDDRHPDSESEPEDYPCRAECIAWRSRGTKKTVFLTKHPCCEPAVCDTVVMLTDDLRFSDTTEFPRVKGQVFAPLCRSHADRYAAARRPDQCTLDGCVELWTGALRGVRRCDKHQLNEAPAIRDTPPSPRQAATLAVEPPEESPAQGLYEVWMPTARTGAATAPNRGKAHYYRFMGQELPFRSKTHLLLHVCDLGLLYHVDRDYLGPWAPETWDLLSESECPALATKWEGTRGDLIRLQGQDAGGATLTSKGWDSLREGLHLQNIHHAASRADTDGCFPAPPASKMDAVYPVTRGALDKLIHDQRLFNTRRPSSPPVQPTSTEVDPADEGKLLGAYLNEEQEGLTVQSAITSLANVFDQTEDNVIMALLVEICELLRSCQEAEKPKLKATQARLRSMQEDRRAHLWDSNDSDEEPLRNEGNTADGTGARAGSTGDDADAGSLTPRGREGRNQITNEVDAIREAQESARRLTQVTQELSQLRKQGESGHHFSEGSLGHLACPKTKHLIFLARQCDSADVTLCQHSLGRDLYDDLQTAGETDRDMLSTLGFPAVITNRLRYAIAAGLWGGRTVDSASTLSLLTQEFPLVDEETADAHLPAHDHRIATRTGGLLTLDDWVQNSSRAIKVFALVYGRDHAGERTHARDSLARLRENQPHVYTLAWLYNVWEELNWRWWEELKLTLKALLQEMGNGSPSREDLRFYALAPGPDGLPRLRMPTTFQLGESGAYYLTTIAPRMRRLHENAFHRSAPSIPTDSLDTLDSPTTLPLSSTRAGHGEQPELMGRALILADATRAKARAPRSHDGSQELCWNFSTHRGCTETAATCEYSHEAISHTQTLDWTVRMQIIRRGGLRSGKKIPASEVDGRLKQVRETARQEDAEKRESKGKATPNLRAGAIRAPTTTPPQWDERFARMMELDERGVFQSIRFASPELQTLVRSTTVEIVLTAGPVVPDVATILSRLAEYAQGTPLAQEAELLLTTINDHRAAASEPTDALPLDSQWGHLHLTPDNQFAENGHTGTHSKLYNSRIGIWPTPRGGDGLALVDYGSRLAYSFHAWEEMKQHLATPSFSGPNPPEEDNQCMLLAVVAATLWAQPGCANEECTLCPSCSPPSRSRVLLHASNARVEMHRQVREAEDYYSSFIGDDPTPGSRLGATEPWLTPAESSLKVFIHDATHLHHDMDVRSLVCFPITLLRGVDLVIFTLDDTGRPHTIIVRTPREAFDCRLLRPAPSHSPSLSGAAGAETGNANICAYVLIHQQHAHAIQPPLNEPHHMMGKVTTFEAHGWGPWLDLDHTPRESHPHGWATTRGPVRSAGEAYRCPICAPDWLHRRAGWLTGSGTSRPPPAPEPFDAPRPELDHEEPEFSVDDPSRPAAYSREEAAGASSRSSWEQPPNPSPMKCRLLETLGDIFAPRFQNYALAHCVDSHFQMSDGIATLFSYHFGGVEELRASEYRVGQAAAMWAGDRYIYHLVTKRNHWDKPLMTATYDALSDMLAHMQSHDVLKLCMPHIECGLNKQNWTAVRRCILAVLGGQPIDLALVKWADRSLAYRPSDSEDVAGTRARMAKEDREDAIAQEGGMTPSSGEERGGEVGQDAIPTPPPRTTAGEDYVCQTATNLAPDPLGCVCQIGAHMTPGIVTIGPNYRCLYPREHVDGALQLYCRMCGPEHCNCPCLVCDPSSSSNDPDGDDSHEDKPNDPDGDDSHEDKPNADATDGAVSRPPRLPDRPPGHAYAVRARRAGMEDREKKIICTRGHDLGNCFVQGPREGGHDLGNCSVREPREGSQLTDECRDRVCDAFQELCQRLITFDELISEPQLREIADRYRVGIHAKTPPDYCRKLKEGIYYTATIRPVFQCSIACMKGKRCHRTTLKQFALHLREAPEVRNDHRAGASQTGTPVATPSSPQFPTDAGRASASTDDAHAPAVQTRAPRVGHKLRLNGKAATQARQGAPDRPVRVRARWRAEPREGYPAIESPSGNIPAVSAQSEADCRLINQAYEDEAMAEAALRGLQHGEIQAAMEAYTRFFQLTQREISELEFMEVFKSSGGIMVWYNYALFLEAEDEPATRAGGLRTPSPPRSIGTEVAEHGTPPPDEEALHRRSAPGDTSGFPLLDRSLLEAHTADHARRDLLRVMPGHEPTRGYYDGRSWEAGHRHHRSRRHHANVHGRDDDGSATYPTSQSSDADTYGNPREQPVLVGANDPELLEERPSGQAIAEATGYSDGTPCGSTAKPQHTKTGQFEPPSGSRATAACPVCDSGCCRCHDAGGIRCVGFDHLCSECLHEWADAAHPTGGQARSATKDSTPPGTAAVLLTEWLEGGHKVSTRAGGSRWETWKPPRDQPRPYWEDRDEAPHARHSQSWSNHYSPYPNTASWDERPPLAMPARPPLMDPRTLLQEAPSRIQETRNSDPDHHTNAPARNVSTILSSLGDGRSLRQVVEVRSRGNTGGDRKAQDTRDQAPSGRAPTGTWNADDLATRLGAERKGHGRPWAPDKVVMCLGDERGGRGSFAAKRLPDSDAATAIPRAPLKVSLPEERGGDGRTRRAREPNTQNSVGTTRKPGPPRDEKDKNFRTWKAREYEERTDPTGAPAQEAASSSSTASRSYTAATPDVGANWHSDYDWQAHRTATAKSGAKRGADQGWQRRAEATPRKAGRVECNPTIIVPTLEGNYLSVDRRRPLDAHHDNGQGDRGVTLLWKATPYVDSELPMSKAERMDWTHFNDFGQGSNHWVEENGSPIGRAPRYRVLTEGGESPAAPHQGLIMGMAEWWKTPVQWCKELYPTAKLAVVMTAALTLSALQPGHQVTLGLAADGNIADGPRTTARTEDPRFDGKRPDGSQRRIPLRNVRPIGLALHRGQLPRPYTEDSTVTVYIGVPMSSLPLIMKHGFRGGYKPGDHGRQRTHAIKRGKHLKKPDGTTTGQVMWRGRIFDNAPPFTKRFQGTSCIYVTRLKSCAAGYPGNFDSQYNRLGELYAASGIHPQYAVIQGTLKLKTHDGHTTQLWACSKGNNVQEAVDPHYVCMECVHVYASSHAHRPFRATSFPPEAQIQTREGSRAQGTQVGPGTPKVEDQFWRLRWERPAMTRDCVRVRCVPKLAEPETEEGRQTYRDEIEKALLPSMDHGGTTTDVMVQIGWSRSEQIRRFKQVERIRHQSDLQGATGHRSEAGARMVEGEGTRPSRGQSQWESQLNTRLTVALRVGAQRDIGVRQDEIFPDDGIQLCAPQDDVEINELLRAQAAWHENPIYCEVRDAARSTLQVADVSQDAGLESSRQNAYEEYDQRTATSGVRRNDIVHGRRGHRFVEEGEVATVLHRGENLRSVPLAPVLEAVEAYTREGKTAQIPTTAPKAPPPAPSKTRSVQIDTADPAAWAPCEGKCGLWNVGLMGNNFCCEACSIAPGRHGRKCLNLRVKDGRTLTPNPARLANLCPHGNDREGCNVCPRRKETMEDGKTVASFLQNPSVTTAPSSAASNAATDGTYSGRPRRDALGKTQPYFVVEEEGIAWGPDPWGDLPSYEASDASCDSGEAPHLEDWWPDKNDTHCRPILPKRKGWCAWGGPSGQDKNPDYLSDEGRGRIMEDEVGWYHREAFGSQSPTRSAHDSPRGTGPGSELRHYDGREFTNDLSTTHGDHSTTTVLDPALQLPDAGASSGTKRCWTVWEHALSSTEEPDERNERHTRANVATKEEEPQEEREGQEQSAPGSVAKTEDTQTTNTSTDRTTRPLEVKGGDELQGGQREASRVGVPPEGPRTQGTTPEPLRSTTGSPSDGPEPTPPSPSKPDEPHGPSRGEGDPDASGTNANPRTATALSTLPSPPPGPGWTRYFDAQDSSTWYGYDGPLGKWFCKDEHRDDILPAYDDTMGGWTDRASPKRRKREKRAITPPPTPGQAAAPPEGTVDPVATTRGCRSDPASPRLPRDTEHDRETTSRPAKGGPSGGTTTTTGETPEARPPPGRELPPGNPPPPHHINDPGFFLTWPEKAGIEIGDSSIHRLVDGDQPRMYTRDLGENRGTRTTMAYSVPGVSSLPGLNSSKYMVSIWHQFFKHWKHYQGPALVYLVPAHLSIPGDLGVKLNTKRVKALGRTLKFTGNSIQLLPPALHVMQRLNLDVDKHFYDSMHLTRFATKEVTLWYWRYIEDQLRLVGPAAARPDPESPGPEGYEVTTVPTPLPEELRGPHLRIVVWDFNASAKQYGENSDRWREFWTSLVHWCGATPEDKPRAAEAMLAQVQGDAPQVSWYDKSRLKTIPKGRLGAAFDERHLSEEDEGEFTGGVQGLPGTPWTALSRAPPAPPKPPPPAVQPQPPPKAPQDHSPTPLAAAPPTPRTDGSITLPRPRSPRAKPKPPPKAVATPTAPTGPEGPTGQRPPQGPPPQTPSEAVPRAPPARSERRPVNLEQVTYASSAWPSRGGLPRITGHNTADDQGTTRVSLSPEPDYNAASIPPTAKQGLPRR